MSKTIVTFGEVMGRFCPENFQRFRQSMPGKLDLTFAGSEANVAASISMLGGNARYITRLPHNPLADACRATLRGLGVDTSEMKSVDYGRLGLYFVERGANQRASTVIYDREYSSIAQTPAEDYDWKHLFQGADWLHTSGITPAISQNAAEATLAAVKSAKEQGLMVSIDLNFRKKLWQWKKGLSNQELARETMKSIIPYIDVVIGNEEDAQDVLDIVAGDSDIEGGHLDIDRYEAVAREIVRRYPNVKKVAITLRESISATHNNWGAMLYDVASDMAHFAPLNGGEYTPYEIKAIVDRVGGGDSFAAGLVYALNSTEYAEAEASLRFAVAASCLCHSINGDFNYVSKAEVEKLMGGSISGRVVR